LFTSELQFGFKAKHATSMRSILLRETLAYYSVVVDGGVAFCTFLDATKVFDCVDFCKLLRELFKRDIPTIYLLLLHTDSVAKVS